MTKEEFVAFLIKQLGSKSKVKQFSGELKALGICDLSEEADRQAVLEEQGAYLFTLVTHFQFGLLNKLVEIQSKIKTKESK